MVTMLESGRRLEVPALEECRDDVRRSGECT